MKRRLLLAHITWLALAPLAFAVISAASPLKNILVDNPYIFVAKVEAVDASKPSMVLTIEQDLKGKFDFRRLPVLLSGDEDAEKFKHIPELLKRVAPGVPTVWFVQARGKRITAFVFTEGTWMQILGQNVDKEKAVCTFAHLEPNLRQTFKGTTAELIEVVKDGLSGKKAPPELDDKTPPGFGPELPKKTSRRDPLEGGLNQGAGLFAVIPTLGIAGPLAILAILFPTVFGGVLILFRQWTAFIMAFSTNSTLYLLYWWKGGVWLRGTWWNTEAGIWFVMSLVTLLCLLWAWRRQLFNLVQGIDALETPVRTEYMVLGVLALTCLAFIGGTLYFEPPNWHDVIWNYTLVLTAAIVAGLAYKIFRSVFEVMLPMPTEGVMLGVSALAQLGIFAFLTSSSTAEVGGSLDAAHLSTDKSTPQFVGKKWGFQTKETGLFVSSPLVADGKIFAASAHPSFKGGTLFCVDFENGKEIWNFIDDGDLKQVFSSPTLANDTIYMGEGFHEDPACKLYAIDAKTGDKRWEFKTKSQTEATPAVADGKVYQGCGNDGFFCFAGDAKGTGVVEWQFPPKGGKGRLLRFGAGALVHDGKVFAGTGVDRLQKDDPGETAFFCLDAKTGKELWKIPMPQPVWAAPVMHGGKLFAAAGNGDVFSDAPAPAGTVLCLDPQSGKEVWKTDLPNGVLQKPAVDERNVYVSCRDGHCYALDSATGSIRWKAPLGAPVVASPAIARSLKSEATTSVFAVSVKGKIVCLDPATGTPFWSYNVTGPQAMTFCAAPSVVVRPCEAGEQRFVILGAGDVLSGAKATLLSFEDRIAR